MTEADMTAVILAAGEGRRLEPLTNRRPKPMVPIVNRPLLERVVEAVSVAGISDIILVVGYERERIQTYFGDGDEWDISIEYVVQDTQLGTAHALLQTASRITDSFIALNGDRIIEPEIVSNVCDVLLERNAEAVMAVTRSTRPSTYGVVSVDGTEVTDIIEKPIGESPSEVINAGVYGFHPGIFELLAELEPAPDGEYRLTDALENLLENNSIRAVHYDGRWLDVTYLWDILSVTGTVLDSEGGDVRGSISEGVQTSDGIHIAPAASIRSNTVIEQGSVIGENAWIGPNVTVDRSVIFPDATIQAGSVLKDCIIGANVTIGANTTIAGGQSTIIVENEVHPNVNFGGSIGDNCNIGGGVTVEPGSIIGDEVVVDSGVTVGGSVPDGVTIRRG